MIDSLLKVIVKQLNERLKHTNDTGPENLVELSRFYLPDGQFNEQCAEKIVCSVVNIEEERQLKNNRTSAGLITQPPLQLSLYVLFAANLKDYHRALKMTSSVLSFFQSRAVLNHQNSPRLPEEINKVFFELYTLTFEQINHLWGSLGTSYMPSALYKVRLIIDNENMILEEIPYITKVELPPDAEQ